MWYKYSFYQKKKTSKIAVDVKVGGDGEKGFDKIVKSWGRNSRGF